MKQKNIFLKFNNKYTNTVIKKAIRGPLLPEARARVKKNNDNKNFNMVNLLCGKVNRIKIDISIHLQKTMGPPPRTSNRPFLSSDKLSKDVRDRNNPTIKSTKKSFFTSSNLKFFKITKYKSTVIKQKFMKLSILPE